MKGNNKSPNDGKKKKKPLEIINYIEEFKIIDENKNKNKKKNRNNKKFIKDYIKEELDNYYNPIKNSNSQNNLVDMIKLPNENIKENIRKSKSYSMLEDLVKQINNENINKKNLNNDILLNKLNYLYVDFDENNINEIKNISEKQDNISFTKLKKNNSLSSLNELININENNQISLNELNNFLNEDEKINNQTNLNKQSNNPNKKKKNKDMIITTEKNKIDYTTIQTPFKNIGEELITSEINTKYKDKKKNTINQSMITKIRENFKSLVYEDYNQKPNLSEILVSNEIDKNLKLKIIRKYIKFISEDEVFSEEAEKIKVEINNLIKIKNVKISNDYEEIWNKINNKEMPENLKIKLQELYFRILINEDNKLMTYINNIIRLPYHKIENSIDIISRPEIEHNEKVTFINNIYDELNNNLFGLDEVKDSIISFICQKINNPELANNKYLCLCGPAGVGKTSIVHSVANALKIPYSYISLANVDESSILIGHSYTYEGSIPGCISEALNKNGCINGIILFDELDKTREKIHNILLGIFDPIQNYKFRDAYYGDFLVNLSESMMIICLNDIEKINPILRDRLHIVNIPGYTIKEKKIIIDKYILPKLEIQYKLKIKIDEKVIDYILEKTEIHKGIRQIIMNITKIYELCILDKFTNKYKFNNEFNYDKISMLKLNNDENKPNNMYI